MCDSKTYRKLIDVAGKESLLPYNDGRKWFLVGEDLDIDIAAEVIVEGRIPACSLYMGTGQIKVFNDLRLIPGDTFECIYLENGYIIKECK